jgi:hypothetical protein
MKKKTIKLEDLEKQVYLSEIRVEEKKKKIIDDYFNISISKKEL